MSIERRLAVMKAFHKAGVRTTCLISPVFPVITDVRAIATQAYVTNDDSMSIGKLGLEPLSAGCNAEYLQRRFGKRKKKIRECLPDQSVIAGIGNIYSDEILYRAKICPIRSAGSLTAKEWQRLSGIIPECLSYFIRKNRIEQEDYLKTKGQDYRNTPFLQVYGHAGESCPNCGNKLCRTVIGGRSSVYCPDCQINRG